MEALMIVLGVVFAYLVFVGLAVVLARMIFPKIEIGEDELIDARTLSFGKHARTKKQRHQPRGEKKYSLRTRKLSTGYTFP